MPPPISPGLLSFSLSSGSSHLTTILDPHGDIADSATWVNAGPLRSDTICRSPELHGAPAIPTAVRLLSPLPSFPRPSLTDLFGEIGSHPDIQQAHRFLEASAEERRRMTPPSLSRLKKVRDRLAARSFESAPERAAQGDFVGALTDWQTLPPHERLRESVEKLVPFSNEALKVLWSISDLALSGLYAAAVSLPERHRNNLSSFLANRMIDAFPGITVEGILETVALMADRRVSGFSRVFVPREIKRGLVDHKFLSSTGVDSHRIPSLLAECRETLRIAGHPAVVNVSHDRSLSIDWGRLTREEDAYIRTKIEPHIRFPFRCQHDASVDVYYQMGNGHRRIVEVKTAQSYLDFPEEHLAKETLQVFRHALLARFYKLEGVEYVLCAPRFATRAIIRVKEILDLTGTNYVLTLRRPSGGEVQVIERGMKHLGGDMPVPTERRYPFVF